MQRMGPIGKEAKVCDHSPDRRGEIGTIVSLSPTHILVKFEDGTETWILMKHIVGIRTKDKP